MQHLEHLFLLQYREESVEQDLQADRQRLTAVEDQAGDVKRRVWLNWFGSTVREEMSRTQLVQRCNTKANGGED